MYIGLEYVQECTNVNDTVLGVIIRANLHTHIKDYYFISVKINNSKHKYVSIVTVIATSIRMYMKLFTHRWK